MSTKIVKFNERDWKVTPFHCLVGDIAIKDDNGRRSYLESVFDCWRLYTSGLAGILASVDQTFSAYPTDWNNIVADWRCRFTDYWHLNYTNNPFIVNEYNWDEITLACIENGKVILINFNDLPGVEDAKKVYTPGEFWISHAEGGFERCLREGRAGK